MTVVRSGSLGLSRTQAGKVKLVLELGSGPFRPTDVGITVSLDADALTLLWANCLAGQSGAVAVTVGEVSGAEVTGPGRTQERETRRREQLAAMGPAELNAELAQHRAKIVAKLAGSNPGSLDEVLMRANSIRSLVLELHRRGLPWQ